MKKNKIVVFAGTVVLLFTAGSVIFSCVRHGKSMSVNTGYDADGHVYSGAVFSRITKVIVADRHNRSVRKELPYGSWEYDRKTGRFTVTGERTARTVDPIFHIEGSPLEPRTFVLNGYAAGRGPAAVFFNGRQAVENRDYTLDPKTGTLVVCPSVQNADSYSIVWETADGMCSMGEMTESERDRYSELQAAWFADCERRDLQAQTEVPDLDFTGGTPVVRMRPVHVQEKQAMIDAVPVYAVKDRTKTSRRALLKETGIRSALPASVSTGSSTYSCVSTVLIDSSVRGERALSVEKTYSADGQDGTVTLCVALSGAPAKETAQWPVRTDRLAYAVPVTRQTAWNIVSGTDGTYRAGQSCTYTWEQDGTWYNIETEPEHTARTERFIQEAVRYAGR